MNINVEQNISLATYTTLKVGGLADYFVKVQTVEELRQALQFASQTAVPVLVLGGGSNLLISDEGYRGLVVKNDIKGCEYSVVGDAVLLSCGAGEVLDEVVKDSTKVGYWGLENLSAIPGSIGATPIQNVGAYGVEVSSLIVHVFTIHCETLEEKVFANDDCQFAYRDSFFKTEVGRKWIVTKVVFKLSVKQDSKLEYGSLQNLKKFPELTPEIVRVEIEKIRLEKFPDWHHVGTAGSFFKNPIISIEECDSLLEKYPDLPTYPAGLGLKKISLGWVLDNICNLRGYCDGGVCLYEKQALVLINAEGKSAVDIDCFANNISEIVEAKTGIKIEREVTGV